MKTYTRKQYLNGECSHNEYYGQFVTDTLKQRVIRFFGEENIKEALKEDPHLNNIPLKKWDNLAWCVGNSELMKAAGEILSLSTQVCVLKASARMIT